MPGAAKQADYQMPTPGTEKKKKGVAIAGSAGGASKGVGFMELIKYHVDD